MIATPRTDAMRLKMAQLGWRPDGEPVAMLMASHDQIERELAQAREWSSKLADLGDDLRSELAAKDAHADEIYKAAVNLAAKLEDDLAAERALADRLAKSIHLAECDGNYTPNRQQSALAAWKEARRDP